MDGNKSVDERAAPLAALEEMRKLVGLALDASSAGRGAPGSSAPASETSRETAEVVEFVSQATFLMMTSGLRWWIRTAEIWGRLGPALAQRLQQFSADGAQDEATRAQQMDELRADLRELTESPGQEARLLQADLDRLLSRLLPASSDESGPYRRRWHVKP